MYHWIRWTFGAGGGERNRTASRSAIAVSSAALAALLTFAGASGASAQLHEQDVNRWKQYQSQQMLRQSTGPVERSLRESGRQIEDRALRQSERLRLEGTLQQRTIPPPNPVR